MWGWLKFFFVFCFFPNRRQRVDCSTPDESGWSRFSSCILVGWSWSCSLLGFRWAQHFYHSQGQNRCMSQIHLRFFFIKKCYKSILYMHSDLFSHEYLVTMILFPAEKSVSIFLQCIRSNVGCDWHSCCIPWTGAVWRGWAAHGARVKAWKEVTRSCAKICRHFHHIH